MLIAGGVYREECVVPYWSRIFGSGGRAGAVLASISPGSVLHAYVCRQWAEDARCSFQSFGISAQLTEIELDICFQYFHPLSAAAIHPVAIPQASPLIVKGDAVLRFGFVEGHAIVSARRAVYDPQHWSQALIFSNNGSNAEELAIVLNEHELWLSTNATGQAAVNQLRQITGATIVVVKLGPRGAAVYERDVCTIVPAYRSDTIFKIGSGDVFSAIFAYHWAECLTSPVEAAESASRSVASYVSSRDAQFAASAFSGLEPVSPPENVRIYLAGPFFNLAQRWLIEETRRTFISLGVSVFSPLHEVGQGANAESIAQSDLEGLRGCSAVFAIADGEDAGTLFEIGYARSRGIPVVALAESPHAEALVMLSGSGCEVVDDFCSAIYRTIWAATK